MQFANIYELIQKLDSFRKEFPGEPRERLLKFARESFNWLSRGAFRQTFIVTIGNENFVLKIASYAASVDSNKAEAKLWKVLAAEDEKFFAKLIAHDTVNFHWAIMEFIKNEYSSNKEFDKNLNEIQRLAKKYEIEDIFNCIKVRSRPDGSPVIIDWGCN